MTNLISRRLGFLGVLALFAILPARGAEEAAPPLQPQESTPARPRVARQPRVRPSAEETTPAGKSTLNVPDDPFARFCQDVYYSAKRGALWLKNSQRPEGLFVYGWIPSLNRAMPEDNHLRQAGAAAALARAAATTDDSELALAARRAIVVLLSTYTEQDPAHEDMRRPNVSPTDANPVGFAGLMLLAISELPSPTPALIDQGEKLGRFIASRQRADGSLNICASYLTEGDDVPGGIDFYPGEALYALMRSYPNKKEKWKLEVVQKAFDFYRGYWKEHPSAAFVPWQSAAFAEAFFATGDKRFAELVFEMNDWVLKLQYVDDKSVDRGWIGGFGSHEQDRIFRTIPGASTASYLEGLVEACRVAKVVGDLDREKAYVQAIDLAVQFLMANQYSTATAPHFEHWFAQKLNGAFHASVVDGSIRIDYTQHAISGMFNYLNHVVRYTNPDRRRHQIAPDAPKAN